MLVVFLNGEIRGDEIFLLFKLFNTNISFKINSDRDSLDEKTGTQFCHSTFTSCLVQGLQRPEAGLGALEAPEAPLGRMSP